MKTIFDTNNDAEIFFKYLDEHPDFKVEFSNSVIDKIADKIIKGSYYALIDSFVRNLNKHLENCDVKYEVNPANNNKLNLVVNTTHFSKLFRDDIIEIARQYAREQIVYTVGNEIREEVRKQFLDNFGVENLQYIIQYEIQKQVKAMLKTAVGAIKNEI